MTDEELDNAEKMLLEQLAIVKKEIKELKDKIKKENDQSFIVCIGNAAFFNFT